MKPVKNVKKNSSISIQQAEVSNRIFYVKYMVCLRDKLVVRSEIEKLDLHFEISVHGAIELLDDVTDEILETLRTNLMKSGLILLSDVESSQIDKLINTVVEIVHYCDVIPKSDFLETVIGNIGSNKEQIRKLFTDVKGISINQFIVFQKIERIKELVLYNQLTFAQIAEVMNYRSLNYMSAQFKKVTGLNLSYFRQLKKERAKLLN